LTPCGLWAAVYWFELANIWSMGCMLSTNSRYCDLPGARSFSRSRPDAARTAMLRTCEEALFASLYTISLVWEGFCLVP
jgi:hypothetical protein